MRLISVFFACATIALLGQSDAASLSGTLTDPTGAAMRNISITARNEATGVLTSTVTGDEGLFSFPALRPGLYTVSASAEGFKRLERTGITLQVNQVSRFDLVMQLGSTSDTVSVVADVSLLETETSGRGATIDTRKIVELPLNGRDYNQLALLSPGVLAPSPRLQTIEFKGAFNVNGNRVSQCVSSGWSGQYLVFKFIPWWQYAGRAAVGGRIAGVQNTNQCLLGGIWKKLRSADQRGDQVGRQPASRIAL